ncbi:MAG: ATP-binding cassette domain-containing protein [Clostridia bacterium]
MSIYCNIKKKLGDFQLDAKFEGGNEVLSLLGASGSGKSMILRCIAGIETPDFGEIIVDDKVLFNSEKRINLPPRLRKTGLLFQDYALFPNMTVSENILLALDKKEQKNISLLSEILEKYELINQKNHYPSQLSGGQKQRCAIARMILTKPNIILLDEPFSALDTFLKDKLEKELFTTLKNYKKTVLFVSHNRDEVYRQSQKISVVSNGVAREMRKKEDVFHDPQTYESAILTGCKNIFSASFVNNTVKVPALNTEFSTNACKFDKDFNFIGMRAKDIFHLENSSEINDNLIAFSYKINEIVEEFFYDNLVITPLGATQTISAILPKDVAKKAKSEQGFLAIEKSKLMFLK